MKKYSFVLLACVFVLFSCASKKGAYEPVPVPRVIEKEVLRVDTMYVIKHDTVVLHDTIVLRDTVKVEVEKKVEVVAKPMAAPEVRVAEEKIQLAEGESNANVMLMKYHVVVGSFKNKDNAKKRQHEFEPVYSPTLVVNEMGMYRVILLSFDTYEQAKQAVAEHLSELPKDTWVLRQKQ